MAKHAEEDPLPKYKKKKVRKSATTASRDYKEGVKIKLQKEQLHRQRQDEICVLAKRHNRRTKPCNKQTKNGAGRVLNGDQI